MQARYLYAWGYLSRDAAEDAIDTMLADREVSWFEKPRVRAYNSPKGRRYAIDLLDFA